MPSPKSNTNNNYKGLELPTRSDITLQLARGLELVRKHRWAHAVVALTSALDLDPYEPKALEYRARCYMMLGQMNSALEDAERLVKVDKQRNETHAENIAAEKERQQLLLLHAQEQKSNNSKGKNNTDNNKKTLMSDDDENNINGQNPQQSPHHVKFASAIQGVMAINRMNTGNHNNKKENAKSKKSEADEELDELLYSPASRKNKNLSPTQKIQLDERLNKPTGSSVQRNRVYYDHSQVVGGGAASDHTRTSVQNRLFGDDFDNDDDDEHNEDERLHDRSFNNNNDPSRRRSLSVSMIGSPLASADKLLENYSPAVSPRKKKNQQSSPSSYIHRNQQKNQRDLASALQLESNSGSPRGLAAETAQKFSMARNSSSASPQQHNNNTNNNYNDLFGDDGTTHHDLLTITSSSGQQQGSNNNNNNNNNNNEPSKNSLLIEGGKNTTKYYHGILLRAQVLFAMGCFEDACRQFHEGFKLRPDVDEFRTGINETEHILLGAVHPWRKRIAKPASEEIAALRSNMETPSSSIPNVSSRPTSAKQRSNSHQGDKTTHKEKISSDDNNNQERSSSKKKTRRKRWVPPKPNISSADRDLLKSMPELSKDYFFLRQLRNHPRIFSTGLGPGITRGVAGISADYSNVRNQSSGGTGNSNHRGPVGGRGSSRAGVGGRFANANDNQDYFLKNAESSTGPAQLAAFCAATAIEAAEEEAMLQQNAQLLAQAESAAERAANEKKRKGGAAGASSSGGSHSNDDHHHSTTNNNNTHHNNSSPSTTTKAHGMFGNQPLLDDDDENSKKRRDFHIRPPDTRSWGVQSARGRRRMKDAVDTTLKYLQTQQNFWAHRDERTSIPMLDEPDLPPRFRPDHKFDNYFSNHRQENAYFDDDDAFNDNHNNNKNSRNNNKTSLNRPHTARNKLNRIPVRPVTTASAETERLEIEENRKRKHRASMAAVNSVHAAIHREERIRREEQEEWERMQTVQQQQRNSESAATNAMTKKNDDHHGKKNSDEDDDDQGGSLSASTRGKENNNELSLLSFTKEEGHHHHHRNIINNTRTSDNNNNRKVSSIPKVVSRNSSDQEEDFLSDMHEVFKLMADQHKMNHDTAEQSEIQFHRNQRNYQNYLANSVGRSGQFSNNNQQQSQLQQAPKITSPEFTFIPQTNRDEVSAHVLAIPSNDAGVNSPAPVFVSENLRFIHQDIQQALSKGQAEVFNSNSNTNTASGILDHSKNSKDKSSTAKNNNNNNGEDLARIQRSLFESGDEPYHSARLGSPAAHHHQHHSSLSPNSQQRAVTLRWGEYDGLHMISTGEDNFGNNNSKRKNSSSVNNYNNIKKKNSIGSSSSEKHIYLSPADQAIERKHQARQFARHQRARALLAQNIQKELGVDLPYEAIFRVPQKPVEPHHDQQNRSRRTSGYNPPQAMELFQPFSSDDMENSINNTTIHQQLQHHNLSRGRGTTNSSSGGNNNNNNNNSPSQYVDGRDYATVSVKASPPRRPWNLKPDAVFDETREQEVARIDAEQKEKEKEAKAIKRARKKKRREQLRRKKMLEVEGEAEGDGFNDDDDQQRNHRRQNNNSDNDDDETSNRQTLGRGRIGTDDDEEEDDFADLSSDSSGDISDEEKEDKKPTMTLDQVRSQYSRSAKQKLRRMSQQSSSSLADSQRSKSMMANSFMRSRAGRSMVGFTAASAPSGRSSAIDSDDDLDNNDYDTTSSDDDDDEYNNEDGDENTNNDEFGVFRSQSSGDDLFGKYESRMDNENTNVAEAVSAARALLEQARKEDHRTSTPTSNNNTSSPYFGFRPQTPQQQQNSNSSYYDGGKKDSNTKHQLSTTSSSFVITNKHESVAMKRLNATLRNISRLCSLGDVPLAISISAALVKELEASDSSSSNNNDSSLGQRPRGHSQKGGGGHHHDHHQSSAANSVTQAFTSLAARLRCTLGALYLEIGEGPAAVGELSRAVLLAKKSQQGEIYEHAVKLLGQCYETSGEEVDAAFENSSTQPRRRRATSIVRI